MPRLPIEQPAPKPDSQKVRFSFEYFQPDHHKFSIEECCKEFYVALLREMLRYQNCTVDHFKDMENNDRRHSIFFPDTTEPQGFPDIDPLSEELWTQDAWQFALPGVRGEASGGWRVHGFISENVFHIVWLDPCHRLSLDSGRTHS